MSIISWQASYFVSLDFSNMLSFLFFCRITFIILSLECILLSSVSQAWLTSDLVFPLSAHFEQRYMPSAPLMLAPGFLQHKICISTCICYDIPMYMCICICVLFLFSPLPSLISRLGLFLVCPPCLLRGFFCKANVSGLIIILYFNLNIINSFF